VICFHDIEGGFEAACDERSKPVGCGDEDALNTWVKGADETFADGGVEMVLEIVGILGASVDGC